MWRQRMAQGQPMRRAAIKRPEAGRRVSRRRILAAAGLAVTCAWIGPTRGKPGDDGAAPAGALRVIRARPGQANLRGADAGATDIWGYDGAIPGPLLRVKRGAEVTVRLVNDLPEPTCVHWHGVHVPNAMDGVPGLTQAPVAPGASFDYRFIPPDAGTFLYRPPRDFPGQLGRGLAGALVVEEAAPVDVDRDVALVLSDWRLADDGTIDPDVGQVRAPHLTANGAREFDIAVAANERLRLRLVNATVARALVVRTDRHQPVVMAIDGEPAEPFTTRRSRVALAPGNRVDLFIDAVLAPGERAAIGVEAGGSEVTVARLVYAATPGRPAPRPDPVPLPDNPLPRQMDLARALKFDVRLQSAADPPGGNEKPLLSIKRGRAIVLGLLNRSNTAMAVHLHGHHFRLLDRLDDGWKPFWLDTVMVPAGESDHIAFVADNPGKWRLDAQPLAATGGTSPGWFEVT
jgi:FtsP/CotA-like multicopper oxidase with cupredoxin domain